MLPEAHNHGPDEGKGEWCYETAQRDGTFRGECIRPPSTVRLCPVCEGRLPAGLVRHVPVCRDIHLTQLRAAIEERRKAWKVDPNDHYVPPVRRRRTTR